MMLMETFEIWMQVYFLMRYANVKPIKRLLYMALEWLIIIVREIMQSKSIFKMQKKTLQAEVVILAK